MAINKRPVTVFYVVAKVNLSESFHGDWFPLESLRIVAQVRALCEGDDTLDCLPDPNKLPESIISKCVEWITLEPNASWHRNLAICYRRSGHIVSAIEHFERALELDPELIEARVGLALAYEAQGYYTKVIDLESANAVILQKRLQLANHEDRDDLASRQKLSISYEAIANSYCLMKDETSALKYWRRAMETGAFRDSAIREYVIALTNSIHVSRWEEFMELLRFLQNHADSSGRNRLTKYIHREIWPNDVSPSFFYMAATAARETGLIDWLAEAYQTAIIEASTKSHMDVLFLKLGLFKLFTKYKCDYASAELLVEEIGDVISITHDSKIQALEDCKHTLARDICRLAVRKSIEAIDRGINSGLYIQRVHNLLRSGIEPDDLGKKIVFREITYIHLAHAQRVSGSIEDATKSIRPYMARCYTMWRDNLDCKAAGLQWLAVCLLALGQVHDARGLMDHVYLSYGWLCDMCGRRALSPQSAAICCHCFDFLCESCLGVLRDDPKRAGFCVPGHHLTGVPSSPPGDTDPQVMFRESNMSVDEWIDIIWSEWSLGRVL
jgi:tetratricopeptide (TPR) repeat protein